MKKITVKLSILCLLFSLLAGCSSHSSNKTETSSSHVKSKKIKHQKPKKKTSHKQKKKEKSSLESENTSTSQVAESEQSQSVPINEVSSAQSVVSTPNTTPPPPANNTPSQNNEQPNKTQVIERVIIREVPKKEEITSSYIESFSQVESYSSEIAPDPEPRN